MAGILSVQRSWRHCIEHRCADRQLEVLESMSWVSVGTQIWLMLPDLHREHSAEWFCTVFSFLFWLWWSVYPVSPSLRPHHHPRPPFSTSHGGSTVVNVSGRNCRLTCYQSSWRRLPGIRLIGCLLSCHHFFEIFLLCFSLIKTPFWIVRHFQISLLSLNCLLQEFLPPNQIGNFINSSVYPSLSSRAQNILIPLFLKQWNSWTLLQRVTLFSARFWSSC